MFKALILHEHSALIEELDESRLPAGDVEIAVAYSSLNYKDGMILNGLGGLVKTYPHVPGLDLAGTVVHSQSDQFQPGDQVICTGWRIGEIHWGGYAQKARLKADWLVPLPAGLTLRSAMGLGAAGLTAAISLEALEAHGLAPDKGEVLVTGAAGGVGSLSVLLLSSLGYQVAASTGRPELEPYLKDLGAQTIIPRQDLAEPSNKPLESARWAACIDSVGGTTLARVLSQMNYGASIASVGLAGGAQLTTTVIPFLLRSVNILGIDSVFYPAERRAAAWTRLATALPLEKLDRICTEVGLAAVPRLGKDILAGKVQGRVIVNPNQ